MTISRKRDILDRNAEQLSKMRGEYVPDRPVKPLNDDEPSFTFMDFLYILAHTYHRPGYPAPGFGRVFGGAAWTAMIIWGIHKLCS